jgi:hypothetical protein
MRSDLTDITLVVDRSGSMQEQRISNQPVSNAFTEEEREKMQ